jgi:hypothetical protein
MTRLVWVTLLAVSAWLSAGAERRHASASDLASVVADAPTRPAMPRAHDALDLLRQLALRGDDRRHARQLGASPPADAPRGAAGTPYRGPSLTAARREPPPAANALAFPYDATAPPPGRRA